jgi:simple sugar transport system ATP-binding protein
MPENPVMELHSVTKRFLGKTAVQDVSLKLFPGEVLCVLGPNGAGKSTLIKILSGVYKPTTGNVLVGGQPVTLNSPQEARALGISTVHQEVGTIPLMSVARNFFLGAEPTMRLGPFRLLDLKAADRIAVEELRKMGIQRVTDGRQTVGTLSGGERQALAIARAVYFGAKVLILDEPTSDLGVHEARVVLKLIKEVRGRDVAVILITHNAHQALSVGDRFAVLTHGILAAEFRRGEKTPEEVISLMAGGRAFEELEAAVEAEPARASDQNGDGQ